MKLSEITEFKNFGNYQTDISLHHLLAQLEQYKIQDGLQLCPDFQRGHVWTEDQKIAFVEFVFKKGKTSPILFNHTEWMRSFEGEFVCVDGLQRLTALTDFLTGILPIFGGNYYSQIDDVFSASKRIYLQYYINDLRTRKEVLEWYLELNSGGTVHTRQELDRVRNLLEMEKNG
jgi:uncharacterized protein with ParB-like and HNH nuclease domain